jgi:hypothetical protein
MWQALLGDGTKVFELPRCFSVPGKKPGDMTEFDSPYMHGPLSCILDPVMDETTTLEGKTC